MQEEIRLLRENVKRFVETAVQPAYDQWEEAGLFPRELWRTLGEQGLLCVDIPEAYGGFGTDFRFSMAIAEEFARANCAAVGGPMMVHSDIVAHYLLNNGTEEQKQRYLPGMVSGDIVGAVAMTEPGAGSDLQGIRTSARRDGDTYVINGAKTFITNGQHCDLVIVVARTDPDAPGSKGTTLFLVAADTPGFARGRNLDKIGLHASDTSELFFEGVRVPASAVLGEVNRGFAVLMNELQRERLALAIGAVAAAEGVLEEAVGYVSERKAFGAPLAELQNTRFRLAEVATDIRVHRAFVDECMRLFMQGELDVATASMAKVATAASKVATRKTSTPRTVGPAASVIIFLAPVR